MAKDREGIEDVLSSVRRLVSAGEVSLGAPAMPARPSSRAPLLLLAPSCRVTEPEDPYRAVHPLPDEAGGSDEAAGSGLDPDAPVEDRLPDGAESDAMDDADPAGPARIFAPVQTSGPKRSPDRPGREAGRDGAQPSEVRFIDRFAEALVAARMGDATYPVPAANVNEGAPVSNAEPSPEGSPRGTDMPTSREALREVVAEIIREELAGEAGARIDRNVRMLVRRELRAMLASIEPE
jgi:hypothetical protein